MPKNKTHSGISKRVKVTGSGKLTRQHAGMRHKLEKKPSTLTRRLSGTEEVAKADVKRAVNAHKKRRAILEQASGYRGQRSRLYRKAKEQVTHSLGYAYRDRRAKKGDFRQLWIQRINAAARANGMTYNRFIQGLKAANIEVDRKILADLAVTDANAFAVLVEVAQKALPSDVNAPKAA